MKNLKKKFAVVFMLVLIVAAWTVIIRNQMKSSGKYNDYLEKAKKYEQKEIYVDALECYISASELKPDDYDIIMKKAEMYLKLGDEYGFIAACDEAISKDKNKAEAYIRKAEYYILQKNYKEAIKTLGSADKIKDSKELDIIREDLKSKYTYRFTLYSDIGDWYSIDGHCYASAEDNGMWGLIMDDGKKKIKNKYDYIGAYDKDAGVLPCCENGEYFYIDISGNKKLAGDCKYDYLGSFGDGYAPAQKNSKYGYIDKMFNEVHFEYDYAGAFINGVAAVKKDGRWALINSRFDKITEFEFDNILTDFYGYCARYGIIVAQKDKRYVLLNIDGEVIGDRSFACAGMPASDTGCIAVKSGDRWGYADREGNIVIEPRFDEAKSFSAGFAPVKQDGAWGYIDETGQLVIENSFEDARPFSDGGIAAVKEFEEWQFVVLCEYEK